MTATGHDLMAADRRRTTEDLADHLHLRNRRPNGEDYYSHRADESDHGGKPRLSGPILLSTCIGSSPKYEADSCQQRGASNTDDQTPHHDTLSCTHGLLKSHEAPPPTLLPPSDAHDPKVMPPIWDRELVTQSPHDSTVSSVSLQLLAQCETALRMSTTP